MNYKRSREELVPDAKSKCTWSATAAAPSPHTSYCNLSDNLRIHNNILEAIGNTPLVRLNRIPQIEGVDCEMLVKCEFLNPGGSVKDRIAVRMMEDAEKEGILKPGCTIIEPTAGNTGFGLAMVAAIKGYKCLFVVPMKMSEEKVRGLRALGAEVVRTGTGAPSDSQDGEFHVSHKLQKSIPNSVILNQFRNPGNPLAHYDGTAEEIWTQCCGSVDMVVAGAGTGGTVTGLGRFFKERSPSTVVVGVDPIGSVLAEPEELNGAGVEEYASEGIGYDFVPTVLDRSVVDEWVKTGDCESFLMARRLIKEEGLLCGGSSGAAVVGALRAAKKLKKSQRCVVILPDGARNYVSKMLDDEWMKSHVLL